MTIKDAFNGFLKMLPPPELLQAMSTFAPRLLPKNNSFKLTDELVPKDSIMRPIFDVTEADRLDNLKSPQERLLDRNAKLEKQDIETPFGKIKVTSMSKNTSKF